MAIWGCGPTLLLGQAWLVGLAEASPADARLVGSPVGWWRGPAEFQQVVSLGVDLLQRLRFNIVATQTNGIPPKTQLWMGAE